MPEGSQLYAPHATPRDDRRLVTAAEFAQCDSEELCHQILQLSLFLGHFIS